MIWKKQIYLKKQNANYVLDVVHAIVYTVKLFAKKVHNKLCIWRRK